MSIYSLPSLISFTLNFSLAVIVLIDGPRQTLNRWFSAFIFNFAIWNIAEVIILNSSSPATALLWGQILYRVIFLSPAFFVIIAYQFPRNYHPWAGRPAFYLAVFALPVLVLSISFPDFSFQLINLQGIENGTFFQMVFTQQPSFLMLLVVSISYIIWGVWVLVKKIPRIRVIRSRNQTKFFTVGMLIISISFILVQSLRPLDTGSFSRYFLTTVFTFLIAVFFFIAIVQFHMFRPRKLLSSSLSYTILSAIVLAIYFLLIQTVADSLMQYFKIDSLTFSGLLIFALVLFVQPFERKLRTLVDRQLNKDIHQYRENSLKLFRKLQVYAEPDSFFKNIETFLIQHFSVDSVATFCLDEEQSLYLPNAGASHTLTIPVTSYLIKTLEKRREVVEFYELDHHLLEPEIHTFFENSHCQIILPLIFDKHLLGLMALSRKKIRGEYSEDELEIFNIFARNIASALQRNNIIREMRDHYKEHFQLEKLAALGQLTAGIAHEIRNPLSTISTSAETLLQPNISPTDQEELKHFIIEEVNRLSHVLTDFLNLSRARPPELVRLDPQELIEYLQLNLLTDETGSIQLVFEVIPPATSFLGDPDLLKQILLNLGLNACAAIQERVNQDPEFTPDQGRIVCRFEVKRTVVQVSFQDNGIGIPKAYQEKILEPFFTTKETGTGLGLSIVQTLVEALGGTMAVTSQPGNTEFSLRFPAKLKATIKEPDKWNK